MTSDSRELYASSNGDRWDLVREGGRVFVRHTPNLSSGGRPSQTEIAAFLARGTGPEQQGLLRLIGTLVENRTED